MQQNGQNFFQCKNLDIAAEKGAIEISVFGRGFGECIVVGCGDGTFVVVDSFNNPETKCPIALDYLKLLNIPYSSIKYVVLTHWHQDHIEGMAAMLKELSIDAKLILSPIFTVNKFIEMLLYSIQRKDEVSKEFASVLDVLSDRGPSFKRLASADKRIYSNEQFSNVEIYTLSPDNATISKYWDYFLKRSDDVFYPINCNENLLSIVLLMKYGSDGVLLGSDMENVNSDEFGWQSIVNNYSHTNTKPTIFKVPHHGSYNGHNIKVWTDILNDEPISILTAFNKGNKLPTQEDIDRLLKYSKSVYLIGNSNVKDKTLERMIVKRKSNVKIEMVPNNIGMVRVRKNIKSNSDYTIETFGDVEKFSRN